MSPTAKQAMKGKTAAKKRRKQVANAPSLGLGERFDYDQKTFGKNTAMAFISKIEHSGEGTGTHRRIKMMTVATKSHFYNPLTAIKISIQDALDPHQAPSRVRMFADMTEEEKLSLCVKHKAGLAQK